MKRILPAGVLLSVLVPSLASGQQGAPTIYQVGEGVAPPSLVKAVEPAYPPQARSAGVLGSVYVEAVVAEDGSVKDARVIQSRLWSSTAEAASRREAVTFLTAPEVTTLGLDERAVAAAEQWTFTAGTREGKPVPVRITMEVTFTPRRPKQAR